MFFRQLCRKIYLDFKAKKFCQLIRHVQLVKRSLHICSPFRGTHTRHVSSKIYLQVIGTPCKDTVPSVLLFTDSER